MRPPARGPSGRGPINRPALLKIFQQSIANNRAGGWRRLTAGETAS
jgi:hypothetical protein